MTGDGEVRVRLHTMHWLGSWVEMARRAWMQKLMIGDFALRERGGYGVADRGTALS